LILSTSINNKISYSVLFL